jgi:gliding motility-associated-like protein
MTVTSSLGSINIEHQLHYGVVVWTSGGIAVICPDLFDNFAMQNTIGFGGFIPPCEPFVYELMFNKPITSISFILHGGGGGPIDGPDGGSEIHVFEPIDNIQNIESVWMCNSSINNNQIFLGDVPLEYHGSGEFTINFNEPVCSFTISGNGCWGGSGFVICTNSIQTPELWAGMDLVEHVCGQDSVNFTAYGSVGPYVFNYVVNGGAVQQISSNEGIVTLPVSAIPGAYIYELVQITDGNGNSMNITCNNTLSVEVAAPPQAQFTATPSTGFVPLQVTTQNQSSNATEYEWFVNDGWLSGAEAPTLTLEEPNTYEITLIASNALGCTDTAKQTIHVLEELQVVIPNVFTPNNDGINDWFGITANVSVPASVVILNRWGNVVFEKDFVTTAGYFQELWNGNGLTDGVYFYRVALDGEGWNDEFVGFVTVKK